jgi:hypothetical protein
VSPFKRGWESLVYNLHHDQIKKDEMGEECGTHVEINSYIVVIGKPE